MREFLHRHRKCRYYDRMASFANSIEKDDSLGKGVFLVPLKSFYGFGKRKIILVVFKLILIFLSARFLFF